MTESRSKLTCVVSKMGGGLYFLVEIELKMSKIPPITNLKLCIMVEILFRIIYIISFHFMSFCFYLLSFHFILSNAVVKTSYCKVIHSLTHQIRKKSNSSFFIKSQVII